MEGYGHGMGERARVWEGNPDAMVCSYAPRHPLVAGQVNPYPRATPNTGELGIRQHCVRWDATGLSRSDWVPIQQRELMPVSEYQGRDSHTGCFRRRHSTHVVI